MVARYGQLDVTEMSRTLSDSLIARSAFGRSIYRAQLRIVEAFFARPLALLVHSLGILDMADAHALDLFG